MFPFRSVTTATADAAEVKSPAVVEKKGKARDKELVSSIPKVSSLSFVKLSFFFSFLYMR